MILQTPAPPPPLPPTFVVSDQLPPQIILLIVLAALAAVTIVFLPLMKALAGRIAGGGGVEVRQLREELDEMRQHIAALEEGRAQVLELEERVDFAERLLAQGHERAGRLEEPR